METMYVEVAKHGQHMANSMMAFIQCRFLNLLVYYVSLCRSRPWPPISWALQDYDKEIGVGEHTDYGLLTILKQVRALRALRAGKELERH